MSHFEFRIGLRAFAMLVLSVLTPIGAVAASLVPAELVDTISSDLERVPEFRFLAESAKKLGVRSWLFGGTAAAFGHYSKWNLQRERGDARFQSDRFDFDYTNIYRSNQDFDIVIDGTAAQAAQLTELLQRRYPHLQGSKSAWEVRLLKGSIGDKEALLDNPDFLNQHSDSNSTGLIEVTEPPKGELRVRDIRQWGRNRVEQPTEFLRDLTEGKLHYYHSERHGATSRAQQGLNPPILSVIRYLTKLFQYELTFRPEDWERIEREVSRFDPKSVESGSYVARWIEKNGKKLIQNAVNSEYAWDTLQKLGLREKLIAIRPRDMKSEGTLSWWLSKEPLRTSVVGRGKGRTAAELGLTVVAHETRDLLAYENITRAPSSDPNVFVSRKNVPGERASYGEGFYTRVGQQGAGGTGITIRFKVDPKAREGTDFVWDRQSSYVRWLNRAAIHVVPEAVGASLVDYFQFLSEQARGGEIAEAGFAGRLERRMRSRMGDATQSERAKIHELIEESVKSSPDDLSRARGLRLFLTESLGADHPRALEWLVQALKSSPEEISELVIEFVLPRFPAGSPARQEWLMRLFSGRKAPAARALAEEFGDPRNGAAFLRRYPQVLRLLKQALNRRSSGRGAGERMAMPWSESFCALLLSPTLTVLPESVDWVEQLLSRPNYDSLRALTAQGDLNEAFLRALVERYEKKSLVARSRRAYERHILQSHQMVLARKMIAAVPRRRGDTADPAIGTVRRWASELAEGMMEASSPEDALSDWSAYLDGLSADEIRRFGIEKNVVKVMNRYLKSSGRFTIRGDDERGSVAFSVLADLGRLSPRQIDEFLSIAAWRRADDLILHANVESLPKVFRIANESQRKKIMEIARPGRMIKDAAGAMLSARDHMGGDLYDRVHRELKLISSSKCLGVRLRAFRSPE